MQKLFSCCYYFAVFSWKVGTRKLHYVKMSYVLFSKMWHQFWVQHIINSLCTDSKIYTHCNECEILGFPSQNWGVGILVKLPWEIWDSSGSGSMGWVLCRSPELPSLVSIPCSTLISWLVRSSFPTPLGLPAAHKPSTMTREQLVPPPVLPRQRELTMSQTPSHPFCLFICILLLVHTFPLHLHMSLCHQEEFLTVSPKTIPQSTPPSPCQDPSALPSTTSLHTHALPSSSGCSLSPVPLWCHTSFTPFIFHAHSSWIKTKEKSQIPKPCHKLQDKWKTSFPCIPRSLQSSKRLKFRQIEDPIEVVKSLTTWIILWFYVNLISTGAGKKVVVAHRQLWLKKWY